MAKLPVSRRHFIFAAFAGTAVAQQAPVNHAQFDEPAQKLELHDDADVIVCGAGPAGIAAAITAARAGARTRLFEVHGCLGGVWTAGLLTYIFDFDKPGLTREITRRLDEREARRNPNPSRFVYEPEEMKILLDRKSVV